MAPIVIIPVVRLAAAAAVVVGFEVVKKLIRNKNKKELRKLFQAGHDEAIEREDWAQVRAFGLNLAFLDEIVRGKIEPFDVPARKESAA